MVIFNIIFFFFLANMYRQIYIVGSSNITFDIIYLDVFLLREQKSHLLLYSYSKHKYIIFRKYAELLLLFFNYGY